MSLPSEEFVPTNPLEQILVDAQAGRRTIKYLLQEFLKAQIAMPSSTEVLPDGSGLSPVFYDKLGVPMVAVFTSLERAKRLSNIATYVLCTPGSYLVSRLLPECGMVVNPGFKMGFDISPSGLQDIRRDLMSG